MKYFLGIDIGGTKCAVSLGKSVDNNLKVVDKMRFLTPPENPQLTIAELFSSVENLLAKHCLATPDIETIGISCGGPLDSKRGVVISPPNLPKWDNIKIVEAFERRFSIPCALQNDANACALAEWKFGAGRGYDNMVFLTFGTGLGAGLILDGKLYAGTNDNAGEIGHIGIAEFGPVGYGKRGSFEGFCSGAGIARIARDKVLECQQRGEKTALLDGINSLNEITAKNVANAADMGDRVAIETYAESGRMLGKGLAIVVDILNPQAIVIGGIFTRSQNLLLPFAQKELARDALPNALDVCKILPAKLGELIGDYAALSVAAYKYEFLTNK